MAKYIKPGREFNEAAQKEFQIFMANTLFASGFGFSKETRALMESTEKAHLTFTATAYVKMQFLIHKFSGEVAWHGVCRRTSDDKSEFVVEDILVYPQEVGSATVNTDQQDYQEWLYNQPDEVFNNIRFQGHSHVNMPVNPSGVDLDHQKNLLSQMADDMFYVFVIWNKRNERTVMIYDYLRNLFFDTKDVEVDISNDDQGFFDIVFAEEIAKTKPAATYTYANSYTNPSTLAKTSSVKATTVATTPTTAPTNTGIVSNQKPTGNGAVSRADGYAGTSCGNTYYLGQGQWVDDDYGCEGLASRWYED